MIDGEVALTLVLMDTYITLMIWIGHFMRMTLTKLENIADYNNNPPSCVSFMPTIPVPLQTHGVLLVIKIESRQHSRQVYSTTDNSDY